MDYAHIISMSEFFQNPDPVVHVEEPESDSPPGPPKLLSCVIYFLLIFLAIMGLAYFGYALSLLNDQLNFGIAQKAWNYGHQLESEGWEVKFPTQQVNFIPPAGDGSLIYFVAKGTDDEIWTAFVWEYYRSSESSRAMLRERNIPDNLWWLPSRSFLIPRSEGAIDAHRSLNLPLPDSFVLEEVDEDLTNKINAFEDLPADVTFSSPE